MLSEKNRSNPLIYYIKIGSNLNAANFLHLSTDVNGFSCSDFLCKQRLILDIYTKMKLVRSTFCHIRLKFAFFFNLSQFEKAKQTAALTIHANRNICFVCFFHHIYLFFRKIICKTIWNSPKMFPPFISTCRPIFFLFSGLKFLLFLFWLVIFFLFSLILRSLMLCWVGLMHMPNIRTVFSFDTVVDTVECDTGKN